MILGFETRDLLPDAWKQLAGANPVRAFNPALLRCESGWLLAYRVVMDTDGARRIAVCRLDERFSVVAGSALPVTDWIKFPATSDVAGQGLVWFADPRLYRLASRLFLYWNSGWHEPRNYQFLQELDPATLRPIGSPRELALAGARQKLEKNWALFESGGLYAVYSVNPHRVLSFSLERDGPIQFEDVGQPTPNPGGYAKVHGGLRGGAPPQRVGDHFWSFCHSIENAENGYRYVASVYRFSAHPPFAPCDMPGRPLPIEVPAHLRRSLPKLNPAVGDVVYPSGAAFHAGKWIISLGIDDERCALAQLEAADVLATLTPT